MGTIDVKIKLQKHRSAASVRLARPYLLILHYQKDNKDTSHGTKMKSREANSEIVGQKVRRVR